MLAKLDPNSRTKQSDTADRADVPKLMPQHDDFSLFRRGFSVVCIATATVLVLWSIIRLWTAFKAFPWWLPIVTLAGMVAMDFFSGLIHWTADTWGSESMPILGRRFLHPFRVHHVNPDDFLRRRFIDTNGDVSMLMIPALVAALSIPLGSSWQFVLTVFIVAFCAVGLLTNQVHQWAHMSVPPAVVRILQNWGVILGREAHGRHHKPPYAANYCIATGWCNRPLTAIEFWRRLECLVTWLTGIRPRHDDSIFQANADVLLRTRLPKGDRDV